MIAAIDWRDLAPGDHRLRCPACGRGPKDQTLGATVEHDGRGVAHCFRCGFVETRHQDRVGTRRPGRAPARPMVARKRSTLGQWGHDLWRSCSGLSGTTGEAYLLARGCRIPPTDGDLRYHEVLRHPTGFVGSALVALLTDAIDATPRSLHFTWIRPDGTKAPVDPPRQLLAGHVKRGAVIRLWPDEAVTLGLLVAEGIETTLAAARDYSPAWAAIDAGNLAALPILGGVETLVIAADHDDIGLTAATRCADRWAAAGIDVRVIAPATPHTDWADARAAR